MSVTCRYLRRASLAQAAVVGPPLDPGRRRGCCVRGRASAQGRRGYLLMSLLRGAHDSVMSAVEIGGWVTGRHALPARSRPEHAAEAQSRSSHSSNTGNLPSSAAPTPSWKLSAREATASDPDSEATLPEKLRSVFRLLTNPVVVCTASHGGVPRAMTMSSFTSLTLSPVPLVSFNIATPSRTLDAIVASREFNIHVLAGDAAGAAVAGRFARGNTDGVPDDAAGAAACSAGERASPPLIRGRGVLRVLRCRLWREGEADGLVRVRDHVIVVGEVVEMIPGTRADEFGLAYADRRYRRVGGVIGDE